MERFQQTSVGTKHMLTVRECELGDADVYKIVVEEGVESSATLTVEGKHSEMLSHHRGPKWSRNQSLGLGFGLGLGLKHLTASVLVCSRIIIVNADANHNPKPDPNPNPISFPNFDSKPSD